MAKRVLMVATVPSMIGQFNMDNIHTLLDLGYHIDVATDFNNLSVWPSARVETFCNQMKNLDVDCFQVDFSRSPFKMANHVKSYKEILQLLKDRQYSFIHTHTPIASAIVRLAAHKTGTKVIYTAHGFHFYTGAPFYNWAVFYPIERYLSRYTDVLVTINREDYKRSLDKFYAKKTIYVPGVGIDIEKFSPSKKGREKIREELNVKGSQLVLLSVGELNENKNHELVIKAIEKMNLTYVIVGKGELKKRLEIVAKECEVDLRLMGFRNDVRDFYSAADVYVLPSKREGLNVSLMEAMSCCLPVACSKIRGNTDLIDDEDCLFAPTSIEEIRTAIVKTIEKSEELGCKNREKIQFFNRETVRDLTANIYKGIE